MGELERVSLDDPAWAEFARGHAHATPFHDPAWARVLADCYRLEGFALVERDRAGAITAGLPVVGTPRLPGRPRRLVSLPYTDFVRPLVDSSHEAGFARALDTARRELGYESLELRSALEGARPLERQAVIHTLALVAEPEALLQELSSGKRHEIRASQRSGLVVRRAETEADVSETYFRLHLLTRRRLGVPSQPLHFFRLLWRRLIEPGRGFVLLAEEAGTAVGGAVFLTGNDTVVYKYSATDRSVRARWPADLLLWHAVSEACERGFATFDFGRSELDADGLRRFKDRWGATERPLAYSVVGEGVPNGAGSSGAGLLGEVLRRAPVWLTRVSGELLYRYAA